MTRAQARSRRKGAREIDWASVRRRLQQAATADPAELTPEQAEAVLAQRARALAVIPAPLVDRSARIDVVTVRIAGERYALPTEYVCRMVITAHIAPVPGTPHLLLGVMNFYGDVLPVFDPRPLLGLPPDSPGERAHVIVVGTDRADFGLLVDSADQVAQVAADQLHRPPDSLAPARRELLQGVMPDGLILLDGARLTADPRLVIAPGWS